tara:strand:- start:6416 stop:7684 length:1269 start_codon:yes stop_codon:yes gene_type:complete
MIDASQLKDSVEMENDIVTKEIKSNSLKNIAPSFKNYKEEYKYTPFLRRIERKFDSFNPSDDIKNHDEYRELISDVDKYYIIIVNGTFLKQLSSLPVDIKISNYKDLTKENREIFNGTYSKTDDSNFDIFSTINSIQHQNCLTFQINKSTVLDGKVSILNIVDSKNPVYFRKCFHMGKNSKVSFSEKFIYTSLESYFSNSVTEIFMDENSNLNYFTDQNINKNYLYNSINVFQKKDSVSNFHTYSFSGAIIRNNLNIKLTEKNCYANMYGFYAIKNSSHIDNHTSVDHIDESSISNEHYKGIIDKESNGVFNGKIYVRQKAQKTNAFQANNNILLSDSAKVNTKPQLEIWADDVKCSHGCTVGQLDKDALFYLMSRGISRKDATSLLLSAFSTDITDKIDDEDIREKYKSIILKELDELNHE